MEGNSWRAIESMIGKSYSTIAEESHNSFSNQLKDLLHQKQLPVSGLSSLSIESILLELSQLDSNNYICKAGVGEREGRVYSELVSRRNYYMSHGIGRSGDVVAIQPKAPGSSIISVLAKYLAKHALKLSGLLNVDCVVLPLSTGMSLSLCFLALKQKNPNGKYVIWPRIDQKTCLKCIYTAGLEPIIIEPILSSDSLQTGAFEDMISEEVLCMMVTTSCFAPRLPDNVLKVAKICKARNLPLVVNNAYGLSCRKTSARISAACSQGRVDFIVQSTDKNFMVPVGGAVIASPRKDLLKELSNLYPGRASASTSVDLFITLLQMGQEGWVDLLNQRERLVDQFKHELASVAADFGERLLESPNNTISFAITLNTFENPTKVGAALFSRRVSGTRVVNNSSTKQICGHEFLSYGASFSNYPCSYITAACALGITSAEIELFIARLRKCLEDIKNS